MAKTTSKTSDDVRKLKFKESCKQSFAKTREKVWDKKRQRVRPHLSFKRSYREDYVRELETPGLLHHAALTFKYIFKNWKLFGGLILLAVIANIVLVGLMNEDTYTQFQDAVDESSTQIAGGDIGSFAKAGLLLASTVASGGLNKNLSEVQQVFLILIFLVVWLVTIYLMRHILAGHKIKLRDALYNAMTPLISTLVVVAVIFIELIPIILVIITYSAAVSTEFLSTPFYALLYFIFAALMFLLSGYLLSSSLMALVATSAPGIYPFTAIHTANDLMSGRRIRFIIRIIFSIFVLAIVWVVVMMPIILLDMWLKGSFDFLSGVPVVPFFLFVMVSFSFVYFAAYIYLYYRWMLGYDTK